jgi:hypothetical protein
VRFELRNVVANYPFESSRGFPGSEPNSGHGDRSRLSCSAGDTQLGAGFYRDLQQAHFGHDALSKTRGGEPNLLERVEEVDQVVLPLMATPFMGRTIFGQVFGRGGITNFQNPKVPLTGGRICRTHIKRV